MKAAILFLHEQGVIILQHGLAVFRQAMTIDLLPAADGGGWTAGHHESVSAHYDARTFQIRVMAEYARLGEATMTSAEGLVRDYFACERGDLVHTYFAGREEFPRAATSLATHEKIVHALKDPHQQAIVAAHPGKTTWSSPGPAPARPRSSSTASPGSSA